jgi:hypothetical protein
MFNKKEYQRKWFQKNKIRLLKEHKEYIKKNKDKIKIICNRYYEKNRIKISKRTKKYYQKNKENIRKKSQKWWKINKFKQLISWEGYIPKETKCQCCKKEIYFNKQNIRNAIHFDHKNENPIIKGCPTSWLKSHKRNVKNQKIWESCKFGMLCNSCNRFLPTKNRKEFIINIIKYALKGYKLCRI